MTVLEFPTSGPRVVGVDLSLTGTGMALIANHCVKVMRLAPGARKGHVRLQWIGEQVVQLCRGADMVVIEAIAFGARGSNMFQIAGNWYHVTHELWRAQIPYAQVPATALKKYATGKGNSNKDEVLAATIKRFGHLVNIVSNDTADACVLAAMGADWLGQAVVKLPEDQRKVLESVHSWPVARAPQDAEV